VLTSRCLIDACITPVFVQSWPYNTYTVVWLVHADKLSPLWYCFFSSLLACTTKSDSRQSGWFWATLADSVYSLSHCRVAWSSSVAVVNLWWKCPADGTMLTTLWPLFLLSSRPSSSTVAGTVDTWHGYHTLADIDMWMQLNVATDVIEWQSI